MNDSELRRLLSPRDHSILDATSTTSWIPKQPAETILPYIKAEEDEERSSVSARQKKSKEVFDGYGKIIETCKELEAEISDQCKNVKITLNESNQLRVIEAVQRVFGTDGKEITFQMYQRAISELTKITNSNIPEPEDK